MRLAYWLETLLRDVRYGIHIGVWLLLVAIVLGAMLGPALRAAGADPNQALRQD
jgi:ABC-type lipoprotein release transport system permease subunit